MTTLVRAERTPGLSNAVRSEFVKLLSVRSAQITLVVAVALSAVVAAILTATLSTTRKTDLAQVPAEDVFTSPMLGVDAAAIVAFIAFATYFGAEFSKKQGVTTFAVTPQRERILLAKSIVAAVVGAVIGIGAVAVAVVVGRLVASGLGAQLVSLTATSSIQVMVGSFLQPIFYGVIVGLIATIARSSALAIGAGFVLVLVLPAFAGFLPPAAAKVVAPVLPRAAFDSIAGVAKADDPHHVPLWWAAALLLIWLAVFAGWALRTLRRRDV